MNPAVPFNRYCSPFHHELLAQAAHYILRQRERAYPSLITQGKMKPVDAAYKLELARVLVAQWNWIADPARPPLPEFDYATASHFGAMDHELRAELREVATNARARADREPESEALEQMAGLCEALYWLQLGNRDDGQFGEAFVVFSTDVTRQMAARATALREQYREAA